MATALVLITVIGLLAGLWLDGARARELATRLAVAVCEKRGLQFLDGTVALRRMALRRGPAGLRIRRMFSFDYSHEGSGRHVGWVILRGTELELLQLDEPRHDAPPPIHPQEKSPRATGRDSKVIPFRRPDRHD